MGTTGPRVDGAAVRALRLRRGLSLEVVAGQLGHAKSWLWQVEGGVITLDRLPDVLGICRVLGVPLEQLCATGHDEALSPRPATDGLDALPWTAAGSLGALLTIMEDDVDRRGFILSTGLVSAEVATRMRLSPPVLDAGKATGHQVTDRTVDALERVVVGLREVDNHGGARVTYREPLQHTTDLLRNGSYTDRVGRRLHGLAAELLRLVGWVAYDSDQVAMAQRYWTAGLRTAKAAGDEAMGAHTLASIASLTLKDGHPRDAASQAQSALAHYRGGSPKVRARLHLQAAKCYASMRETDRCRRELGAAEDLVSRFDEPSPDWASWLDHGVVLHDAGWCYTRMQDSQRGVEHIQRGLALHRGFPRDEALFQAHLAVAAASSRRPELDLAVQAANASMDLLEVATSPRCAGAVREVATLVNPWRRQPEVKRTIERIRALPRQAA